MENINFDDIIKLIKNSLDNGFDKLIIGVLVFTSMLAVINLVLKLITCYGKGEAVGKLIVIEGAKYSFFFAVIREYRPLTEMLFTFFTNAGSIFIDENIVGSNGSVSVNMVFGVLIDSIASLTKIVQGGNFVDLWILFYLIILLIAVIFSITIMLTLSYKIIQFYLVTTVALIMFSFNLFEPLSDIGEKAIRAILNSGLQITLALALTGLGVKIIEVQMGEFELNTINSNNNNVLLVITFIILLGIISLMVAQADNISAIITSGQGSGFSLAQAGSQITRGISNTVSTGITVAGIVAGGSGFLKAGADVASKQAVKKTAEATAEKTTRKVLGSSNEMQKMKASHQQRKEELQNRSDYKQANENVNQTNRPDLNTLESQKKVAQNEVSGKSRIDRFKENYNETVQGKGAKIARTATNVTNKGIASATGGESNEINETKGINTAKEKKGEDK